MCVGTAVLVTRACARLPRIGPALAVVLLVSLGARGIWTTIRLGVFPPGEGERRYATIAELVGGMTDRNAVIITGLHTGPLRYYSGRLTLRYDLLDPSWLDRAVEWLSIHGRPPYILLEDWERPLFQRRFGEWNRLGPLPLAPVLAYKAHRIEGLVFLFDPAHPDGPTSRPAPRPNPQPVCAPPAPPPPVTASPSEVADRP